MSDRRAKITARRVDTDVAVVAAGPAGLALFGALKEPAAHEKGRPRS
jgi:ribulose 1,5-bisphosphate synthetase/thiazole synthase